MRVIRNHLAGGTSGFFIALASLCAFTPAALAQIIPDDACPADVAGGSVQCVSQDVSLASVDYDPVNLPSECVAGTEINLDVRLGFVVNANARRYDIATWIAKEPGDIRQPSSSGGPSSCGLLVARQQYFSEIPDPPLPTVPNPVDGLLIVDNLDGDACYDTLPAARQYFAADFPNGLTVTCQPGPSGTLTFQTLVSWSTQNRNNCDGTPSSFVGEVSNSKCAAGSPINLPVNVLSRLVIEKQTIPNGLPDNFDFTGTVNGLAITPFSLSDGGEQELTGALDATFQITEAITDGFEIASIACTNQTTGEPANVTTNTITGEVTVVMSGSQFDVRCVYTNDQLPATLRVVKNTNGGDDLFNFNWASTSNPPNNIFTLDTSTGPGTASTDIIITNGLGDTDFSITETLTVQQVADGWSIESLQCVDSNDNPVGNPPNNQGTAAGISGITLNAGDLVTCTFVNNAAAQVTVTKVAQGGDATFPFVTLTLPGGNFSLTTISGSASTGPIVVPVADSTTGQLIDVTENILAVSGWNLTGIACSGTDETVNSNLVTFVAEPGDVINCTFTNVADGQVTVIKNTLGGDGTFTFTTDLPGATSPFNIQTTDNTGSTSTATPPPGQYFVTETVPVGWDLTNISCDGLVNSTVTYTGAAGGTPAFEPGDTTANIDLAAGEDVSCTFTNTQRGAIVIRKETDPVGSEVFGFTSTSGPATAIPATFDVTAGSGVSFNNGGAGLLAGVYTVTEDDPTPGFDLTDIACIDAIVPGPADSTGDVPTRTATINLDPGEVVTCTFTNTERANLTVQKAITVDFADTTALDNSFDFTSGTLPNTSFSLAPTLAASPDSADFLNLVPGTYDIEEDQLQALADGWALVGATCTDGTDLRANNFEVDLAPGENVTCTFINAPLGSSTIIKNTVGGDGQFDYTGTTPFLGLTLDTAIIGGTASQDYTNQLDPLDNPYLIVETDPAPDGFALTALGCEEMGGTDASGNPVPDNTTTDLAARRADINADYNEMVTCTFTNTADGSLTIRKQTAPDDVDQPFDFTSVEADLTGSIRDFDIAAEELVLDAQPGTYSTTETVPTGWQITGIACTGQTVSTVTYTGATTSPTDGFEAGDDTVNVTLAAGEDVVCEFTNTQESSITIIKNVVGADGVFNFGSAALGNFAIDTAVSDTASFPNRLPGQFLVAENPVPAGYDLTNISCTGDTDSTVLIGADDIFTPGDTGVTIDLAPGEDIVCTFTNTELGSITIAKATDPSPDANNTAFGFTGDVTGGLSDGGTLTTSGLLPGVYTSTELDAPGWDLTDISCDDADSSGDTGTRTATFQVSAGENVTCTFTNRVQRAQIIVDKVTDPAGSSQSFDFTLTGTGVNQAFALTDGATPYNSGDLLPSAQNGTYSVVEAAVDGWTQISATCDNGDDPAAIELFPGDVVTCTFQNAIDASRIVIDKVTDPADSAQAFDFTLAGGGNTVPFQLTGPGVPFNSGDLVPSSEAGLYSVTETVPPDWDLTSATCDDGSPVDAIDVAPNETVTCTFTNTIKRGRILVDKVTDPSGSAQSFDFTLTGTGVNQAFALTDAAAPHDSGELLPTSENGTYNVAEAMVTGWDLTSATCSDGSDPSAVDLAAGETVTCTFTNTIQPARILVDKVTDPAGSSQSFDFTLTGAGVNQAFALTDAAAPHDSGELLPSSENGTYSVIEAAVAGWDLTGVICSDGSSPTAIDLAPGETVTCTFTNTLQRSRILVVQVTAPTGAAQLFDFTLTGTGINQAFQLADGDAPYDSGELLPSDQNGTYSLAQGALDDWPLTSATCDDGSPVDAVDLGVGETVTCTFVNTRPSTFMPVPVPVNGPWALLLMLLSMLGMAWYFRPPLKARR